MKKSSISRYSKDILFIILGILSATFGLKGFLLPNNFIDGGATGIALLASELSFIPLWLLLLLVNLPFVYIASKVVNTTFAFKTSLSVIGLATSVALISFPEITHDKTLVSVFGGFFLGAGVGLSIRGGAVIDGTEVLAIFLSKKVSLTISDIILLLNIVIFSIAAYLLSIEIALYSVITYLTAAKTIDFVIEGIEEYTGVTIISIKPEDIRQMIISTLGRGVTVYHGKGGYGKRGHSKDIDIIYTVITRLELNKLNAEIETIDPEAFVVMNAVKETRGGMIKKRPLQDSVTT